MNYLTSGQVIHLHALLIEKTGGLGGIHSMDAIKSAVGQPEQTFDGDELYKTLQEKASILGFLLAKNHGFLDGNKRISHAAIETFLIMNDYDLSSEWFEAAEFFEELAASKKTQKELTEWIEQHMVERGEA